MHFGTYELARRILNGALSSGGWPSDSDRSNVSITVTSEAILALTEFLEYSKNPSSEIDKRERDEAIQKIEIGLTVLLQDLQKRIEDNDLSIWHYSMSLAAAANSRALFLREGKGLPPLDQDLFSKLIQKTQLFINQDLVDEIGKKWAFLRAIELISRTEHAPIKDVDLWNIIKQGVNDLSRSAATMRSDILTRTTPTKDTAPYEIAIIADICIDILKNSSSTHAQHSQAEAKLKEVISKIQSYVSLENGVEPAFPIHLFVPEGSAPGTQNNNQYKVVTTATLATTFSFALRSKNIVPSGEKIKLYASFYSTINSLHNQIQEERLWGYGPAHCLRTLAEIQINKRDSDAAIDILQTANLAAKRQEAKDLVNNALRKQYDDSWVQIGHPASRFFALFSKEFVIVFTLACILLSYTLHNNKKFFIDHFLIVTSIPWIAIVLTLAWAAYSHLVSYKEAVKRHRITIAISFAFGLVGFLDIMSGVTGYNLSSLLKSEPPNTTENREKKND